MNYVSIKRVAEQVYKSGLNTDEINFYDMVEWAGDAIAKIGVSYAYIDKITNGEPGMPENVTIANYRGLLPNDIYRINGVREATTKVSLIQSMGSFPVTTGNSNMLGGEAPMAAYRIEDGFIYTNFETGELEVSYTAFATDDDGYPMIPDRERYISAVKAYIMYMISFRLWLQDKIEEKKFRALEQEWFFYVKSAKTDLHVPDPDQMEALKNQVTKIVNNANHHATQFRYLSTP